MNSINSSPISQLPLELLEEIVNLAPPAAQLCLCRISKYFHSLSLRAIYREINLLTSSSVVQCCRTLASKPLAAASVKTFTIKYEPTDPHPTAQYFASFYSIIRKALRCLSEIQNLELLVPDCNYESTIADCKFPRLHRFECYLSLTLPLISFLNHHPSINYLQLAPHDQFAPSFSDSWSPVILPNLEYFIGNSECVPHLVRETSLRAAFVFWDALDEEPADAISALERSSSETLSVVSCRRRGWNLDLLDLISTQLPNIFVLSLTNLLIVDDHPSESVLETITGYLSRFNCLQRLLIHCIDVWQMGNVECHMDNDFETVTAWGAACPTLVECSLPHSDGLKWIRIRENLWLPDPADRRGGQWLWNMLYSRRYPEWDKVVDTIEERMRERAPDPRGFEGTIAGLRAMAMQRYWMDEDGEDDEEEETDGGGDEEDEEDVEEYGWGDEGEDVGRQAGQENVEEEHAGQSHEDPDSNHYES